MTHSYYIHKIEHLVRSECSTLFPQTEVINLNSDALKELHRVRCYKHMTIFFYGKLPYAYQIKRARNSVLV